MRKTIVILLWALAALCANAQPKLSEESRVSLLTCAPYEEEVFTVYGHAALRIHDPRQQMDVIFNYGIFDFSKPNFIYRFAKGETDYRLGVANYSDYVIEYQLRGSAITEQLLNLTQPEKQRLWEALLENYKPENRVYRYNFFFDNCATRPAALLESCVQGAIDYHYPYEPQTFRALINECTRNHPWLTFGCDLALGSPTDREATCHEMMFLPLYLKEALGQATLRSADGTVRPLVSETHVIEAGAEEAPESAPWDRCTPLACAWLLCLTVAAITGYEWRRKRHLRPLDALLFLMAGIAGAILFFLSFVSVHPCTCPNWQMIWLQPLHLIAAILFCVKTRNKAAYYYHFINFAALSLLILGWGLIPQHQNYACLPLAAILAMRSGWAVYRKIWNIG